MLSISKPSQSVLVTNTESFKSHVWNFVHGHALAWLNYEIFWLFPSVLWHGWATKGIQPAKKVLLCWWWHLGWSFARLIAPVVTIASIILSSSKIQNDNILVMANRGLWRDREILIVVQNWDTGWSGLLITELVLYCFWWNFMFMQLLDNK